MSAAATEPDERDDSRELVMAGLLTAMPFAFFSFLAAIFTGEQCSGEGTSVPAASSASNYCQAIHLPWGPSSYPPDGAGSALLAAGIFLTPTLLAVAGGLLAAQRRDDRILRVCLAAGGLILLTSWVLILFAHESSFTV